MNVEYFRTVPAYSQASSVSVIFLLFIDSKPPGGRMLYIHLCQPADCWQSSEKIEGSETHWLKEGTNEQAAAIFSKE